MSSTSTCCSSPTEQLRYVAVELKVGVFEPAHPGQLGTYVANVDDQYRRPEIYAPTVRILLCTSNSGPIVKYALAATSSTHLAVADHYGLADDAKASLPPLPSSRPCGRTSSPIASSC